MVSTYGFDQRLKFFPETDIMEVDLSGVTFETSGPVNDLYDAIDRQVRQSGRKWFFLVNYFDCHIMAEAWITFAHRGKKANIAYSLGSVRYAATPKLAGTVSENSVYERFDANMHDSRDAAVAQIMAMRAAIPEAERAERLTLPPDDHVFSYENRVIFHPELEIMEVDFSDLTFERSEDVNACYDTIDRRIEETGRKWYFMVNYRNCKILPDAWFAFSGRGKKVNLNFSLGSVRFEAGDDTHATIDAQSRSENFDANLHKTRDEAIAEIVRMREAARSKRFPQDRQVLRTR